VEYAGNRFEQLGPEIAYRSRSSMVLKPMWCHDGYICQQIEGAKVGCAALANLTCKAANRVSIAYQSRRSSIEAIVSRGSA
jgi:hypothetical protein